MSKIGIIGDILKTFGNATELYDFYQKSELVKISIELSDLFHRYSQNSDEGVKKHIKLEIKDNISRYKAALQEIGINPKDFF